MKLEHFVFDIDGTIIDTKTPVLLTWQKTLKRYGYEFELKDLEVIFGITSKMGLEKLGAKVDDDFPKKWQEDYVDFAKDAVFFDGVEKMLEKLKESGCHLGIISSRARDEYERFFKSFHLERYFDTVVLDEDTKRHKPHGEPAEKYMQLTGAKKENTIYIGDMPTDVMCANNAGIYSALITWNKEGTVFGEEDFLFETPNDVLSLYMKNSKF